MSRLALAAALLVAATSVARADEQSTPEPTSEPTTASEPSTASEPANDEIGGRRRSNTLPGDVAVRDGSVRAPQDLKDQGIGVSVGIATGGRVTPGGLRVEGHYLYQLAEADWFDGTAGFTFGGGDAACFRDRMNEFLCDQGLADGKGVEVSATVRHFLGTQRRNAQNGFWPFVRGGVGVRIARFSDDEVTGLAIPLHAGAGMRISLTPQVALTALAELELGIGRFNQSLGWEPQLGATISAGAEFGL